MATRKKKSFIKKEKQKARRAKEYQLEVCKTLARGEGQLDYTTSCKLSPRPDPEKKTREMPSVGTKGQRKKERRRFADLSTVKPAQEIPTVKHKKVRKNRTGDPHPKKARTLVLYGKEHKAHETRFNHKRAVQRENQSNRSRNENDVKRILRLADALLHTECLISQKVAGAEEQHAELLKQYNACEITELTTFVRVPVKKEDAVVIDRQNPDRHDERRNLKAAEKAAKIFVVAERRANRKPKDPAKVDAKVKRRLAAKVKPTPSVNTNYVKQPYDAELQAQEAKARHYRKWKARSLGAHAAYEKDLEERRVLREALKEVS